jgi:hypothetical protein
MRRLGWKALAAVSLAAALVPAASAGRTPRVKLSLVPLPKSALGAAGESLAVAQESGVVSNQLAAGNSVSGTPKMFGRIGRVTGYDLTYGDPFTGGIGITEIGSGIDQYKTAAAAKKGLAFWRKDDTLITTRIDQYGVTLRFQTVKAPAIGTRRFGDVTTLTVANAVPVALVSEQAVEGKYVLQVGVAGGSANAASGLASKLLRALDHRFQLAEKGRLRARPVELPPRPKAGPPTGGPDLATLALAPTDLTGTATVVDHSYVVDPAALSAYVLDLNPAGQYQDVSQEIEWYGTANEATVLTTLGAATLADELGYLFGEVPIVTPVDVSGVGDNAHGYLLQFGLEADIAEVGLSSGQASDFAVVSRSSTPLQASDVQSLAQAMATHLDVGLPAG